MKIICALYFWHNYLCGVPVNKNYLSVMDEYNFNILNPLILHILWDSSQINVEYTWSLIYLCSYSAELYVQIMCWYCLFVIFFLQFDTWLHNNILSISWIFSCLYNYLININDGINTIDELFFIKFMYVNVFPVPQNMFIVPLSLSLHAFIACYWCFNSFIWMYINEKNNFATIFYICFHESNATTTKQLIEINYFVRSTIANN